MSNTHHGLECLSRLRLSFWDDLSKGLTSSLMKICGLLKSQVQSRKPTNFSEVLDHSSAEKSIIQPECSQKLIDGYQKLLVEVQLAKKHLTKS